MSHVKLEVGLRKALQNDELYLLYQPQLDVRSSEIVGVEALVRWRHAERGVVSPTEFITLAEETGLIVPIGEWVLRTACSQARAWQQQSGRPVRMAVNLSAKQFKDAGRRLCWRQRQVRGRGNAPRRADHPGRVAWHGPSRLMPPLAAAMVFASYRCRSTQVVAKSRQDHLRRDDARHAGATLCDVSR